LQPAPTNDACERAPLPPDGGDRYFRRSQSRSNNHHNSSLQNSKKQVLASSQSRGTERLTVDFNVRNLATHSAQSAEPVALGAAFERLNLARVLTFDLLIRLQ